MSLTGPAGRSHISVSITMAKMFTLSWEFPETLPHPNCGHTQGTPYKLPVFHASDFPKFYQEASGLECPIPVAERSQAHHYQ